jgi:hypothetical protein
VLSKEPDDEISTFKFHVDIKIIGLSKFLLGIVDLSPSPNQVTLKLLRKQFHIPIDLQEILKRNPEVVDPTMINIPYAAASISTRPDISFA